MFVSIQGSEKLTVCYPCNYTCLLCLGLMGIGGGVGGILQCDCCFASSLP